MKRYLILLICLCSNYVNAQTSFRLQFIDSVSQEAAPAITVSSDGKTIAVANSAGQARFLLHDGAHVLSFSSVNYKTQTKTFTLPDSSLHIIYLTPVAQTLEDVTIISSTRNNQRIENSPLKVEVLGREEMDEENSIKPGNIASILGDISGIQIQQSSAVSSNSNVRIQGLEGRYTQILRDGMPLYDGFSGGFGILSIPPLDLKQIELIKGTASTLYGGGAIGGLVNIISRKPSAKQEAVFTLNQTTLKETNLNSFLSKRYKKMGYTFFGGYTRQKATDVNKDGFSDLPELNTLILHPRLFLYPDAKTTFTLGYTGTFEKRNGGDMQVLAGKTDALHQFFEKNISDRHSGEFLLDRDLPGNKKLSFKSSLSSFDRATTTAGNFFKGNQTDYFTELAVLIPYSNNSFVGGVNVTGNKFTKKAGNPVFIGDFSNNTIGLFAQNTWVIKENSTLEAGLREDFHNKYGSFFLPRIALFHRFNEHWGARAGAGMGYKIPNPLAPQIIDYDIWQILPFNAGIKAEKSIGYNAEGNYKKVWDNGNEFFMNHAFFLTKITNPIIVTELPGGQVSFANAAKPIVTKGFDTYIQTKLQGWEIYCGYTFTLAERKYLGQNQFMPLTPRDRMAFTIVRDFEEQGWRIGLEGSWTGQQHRFDATKTPGYFFGAAMVEKKFGEHISIVLNGENLLDYRQSKIEPLYTGTVTHPQFQPLWAPIDGRVVNCSIRIKPF